MLLSVRALYCRKYLSGDAEFGERSKRGLLLKVEIPDGLEQTDHALLNHVLSVRACKKVSPRFGAREVSVAGEQNLDRLLLAVSGLLDQVYVFEPVELECWSNQL
jgi:hypothetical protein